jgi:hypothetical protein
VIDAATGSGFGFGFGFDFGVIRKPGMFSREGRPRPSAPPGAKSCQSLIAATRNVWPVTREQG